MKIIQTLGISYKEVHISCDSCNNKDDFILHINWFKRDGRPVEWPVDNLLVALGWNNDRYFQPQPPKINWFCPTCMDIKDVIE